MAIDERCLGGAGDGVVYWRRVADPRATWIGNVQLVEKRRAILTIVLKGNADERDAPRLILGPGLGEHELLLPAGLTPGGPEVDDDGPAPQVSQMDSLPPRAVPDRDGEVWRLMANQRRRRIRAQVVAGA